MFTKTNSITKRRMIAFLYGVVLVVAATSANAQQWMGGNMHTGPGAGSQRPGEGVYSPQPLNPLPPARRGDYSELDRLGSKMSFYPDAPLGGKPYRPPSTEPKPAVAIRRGHYWLSPN
jgi:hypothetical protein